jgi:hypothetical protein
VIVITNIKEEKEEEAIYQESVPPGSVTPINQTHISATHSGNGTLTLLPNSTQRLLLIPSATVQPLSHLQHHLLMQNRPSEQ